MKNYAKLSHLMTRQSGFSIMEVMIGIAIFAIGMLALASLQGALTRSTAEAKVRAEANRKPGQLNRPMTAKQMSRAPIVENIREEHLNDDSDYGGSTQNISPKAIRTFKAIHIKGAEGEKDHDEFSSVASGSKQTTEKDETA